ncbi:GTD-binding domain [Dillenia turbinata]|uniref:GTD-binding domain n=1 Tax=Dillenia turbinata TaxID=194707 RepID=A0AAN8WH12_9MAGN
MRILGNRCLLVVFGSVIELYERLLSGFIGILMMDSASLLMFLNQESDFGGGFLIFGCLNSFFNVLGLFLMFGLGLKVLKFSINFKVLLQILCWSKRKLSDYRKGFGFLVCYKSSWKCLSVENLREAPENLNALKGNEEALDCGNGDGFKDSKFIHIFKVVIRFFSRIRGKLCDYRNGFGFLECSKGSSECTENLNANGNEPKESEKALDSKSRDEIIDIFDMNETEEEREQGRCNEDEEVDVVVLRNMIKIERHRADTACLELEKERVAAASAAEEAMAMILRLQNEKSSIEIQANQYKREAEHKQLYDQELIESLQWIIMMHENDKQAFEQKLKLCKQKLKEYVNDDNDDDDGAVQAEGVFSSPSLARNLMDEYLDDFIY